MPIKKGNKIQVGGRKGSIENLKTNPDDINVGDKLADGTQTRRETAEKIANMNQVKLMNGITGGRKRKYQPQELLDKCNEYFFSNMIFEEKYDNDGKVIDYIFMRMRAMSMFGLCNYLEISYNSFREMSSTKKYGEICLQAKQKIMDHYIVGGLEGEFDSKVASVIVNMQMQNERIEEGLNEGGTNHFQKIEVNIITRDGEKKIDPIKIIEIKPKQV